MPIQEIHKLFLKCSAVSIDTRNIFKDAFFVAIKGEKFDANTFSKEALENGAKYVIIDNSDYYIDGRTILVNNSLVALQELAQYHRQYLGLPIIALTGSNGKTTTKELINVVLSRKYNVKATIGNLNNHIGVPLTLLSFTKDTEIGIVEMGANHQNEIAFLCNLAQPDYGYVTNFGKAHLEGFGGVEGVIKGKSEMYDYLGAHNKKAFVNFDDELQNAKTQNISRITFSQCDNSATVFIDSIEANPFVKITVQNVGIQSNLIGIYNANNISVALTIGNYFGVSFEEAKKAIQSYIPDNNRSQIIKRGSNEIILDAYNANPSSMKAALENFLKLDKSNKILILGDMYELGEESAMEHKAIIEYLYSNVDFDVYFIGHDFFNNALGKDNFYFFNTFDDFTSKFLTKHFTNASFLIKGSRGMSLERVLEFIK